MSYIGNRGGAPTSESYVEDLGLVPTRFRVFDDDGGWSVDGCTFTNDGKFAYTETILWFPTWDEAVASLPDFAAQWRPDPRRMQ